VGAAAQLFDMDQEVLLEVIRHNFRSKPKAVEVNVQAAMLGLDYARENFAKKDRYRVEKMDANRGKILIEGNTMAALGCLMGGCTVLAWYPITPSSSLPEALIQQFRAMRVDPSTGQHRFADVQCEDELASIGAVLGAGWAGARSMTSTAGPGISLMSEFIGFGYFAEIPGVIFDVQRIGPSTGLPTRTSQGDLLQAYYCSHGDTAHLCLIPGGPEECYEFGQAAFDFADRYQTPVFVLSDLDLGMNFWCSDEPRYPTDGFDRGKVLDAEALEKVRDFGRYLDVDGDGIPYRTLPGNENLQASYFTRGSGHDDHGRYSEDGDTYARNMDRIKKKIDGARPHLPQPVEDRGEGARVGLLAYGTTDLAIREARDLLRAAGLETDYLRLRALPLALDVVRSFVERLDRVYVVEQNRDGQMRTILRDDLGRGDLYDKLHSVLHYTGIPVSAGFICENVLAQEKERSST
jgi:2-oxoglutarate ferredoxin oxidoreductase subunit alpha